MRSALTGVHCLFSRPLACRLQVRPARWRYEEGAVVIHEGLRVVGRLVTIMRQEHHVLVRVYSMASVRAARLAYLSEGGMVHVLFEKW